ncbi:MAG: hypothetical protein RLZZ253_2532, partial [Verrucomicrobiota bacterium]
LELVGWIEGGDGHVEDAQITDGAVDTSRRDHDGGHGFEREIFAIGLEHAFSLEDDVDLGHFFVVMGAAVFGDVGEMNGGQGVVGFLERAAGLAAGAGHGRDGVQLGDADGGPGTGGWSGLGSGVHDGMCGSFLGIVPGTDRRREVMGFALGLKTLPV